VKLCFLWSRFNFVITFTVGLLPTRLCYGQGLCFCHFISKLPTFATSIVGTTLSGAFMLDLLFLASC
jgi:hypothetical protein